MIDYFELNVKTSMPDFSNLCVKIFVFELLFHSKSKLNKFLVKLLPY